MRRQERLASTAREQAPQPEPQAKTQQQLLAMGFSPHRPRSKLPEQTRRRYARLVVNRLSQGHKRLHVQCLTLLQLSWLTSATFVADVRRHVPNCG